MHPTATLACLFAIGLLPPAAAVEAPESIVRVEQAWLDLDLDPLADGFAGRVVFDLRIAQATRSLRLQAQDLRIDAAEALTQAGRTLALEADGNQEGLLRLSAPEALAPGSARIEIRYTGAYRVDGIMRMADGGIGLAPQPASARGRAFPVPIAAGDAWSWELSLALPAAWDAISGTERIGIEKERDGWRRLRFVPTAAIAPDDLHFTAMPPASQE
jgi:aminopeptidase N